MKNQDLEKYILSFPNAEKCFPFNPKIPVYKVSGKIFVLCWEDGETVNLKCNPVYSKELRAIYKAITPGYHMNKKHWNTVEQNRDVDMRLLKSLIEHSFMLVVKII